MSPTDSAPPAGGQFSAPPPAPPPPVADPPTSDAPPVEDPIVPSGIDTAAIIAKIEADVKAELEPMLQAIKDDLEGKAADAQGHVLGIVQDFEQVLNTSFARVKALITELEKGGIVARLHELEMAVASLASPLLKPHDPSASDGHALLSNWMAGIEGAFKRIAAGFAQAKAEAAGTAPPPAPAAPAAESPAQAQIAALGLPPGSVSSRPA